ncbi:MAG TPA: hypothetical protein VMT22_04395 [Terriglobales bacterium]|nr:hypothetical protein [Terriglobales bacterium]
MNGDAAQFEAIGNRLGFRVVEQTPDRLRLRWQGARFPAFLCLGIALLLLSISIPITQALILRGFVGPAGSLWYFPLMNFMLFGIAIFLLTQQRVIELDNQRRNIKLKRQSLYHSVLFSAGYDEICEIHLGIDEIQSGFALGGSTAAQKFPVPALRMRIANGDWLLLDRGSYRKLAEIGSIMGERLGKSLTMDPQLKALSTNIRK